MLVGGGGCCCVLAAPLLTAAELYDDCCPALVPAPPTAPLPKLLPVSSSFLFNRNHEDNPAELSVCTVPANVSSSMPANMGRVDSVSPIPPAPVAVARAVIPNADQRFFVGPVVVVADATVGLLLLDEGASVSNGLLPEEGADLVCDGGGFDCFCGVGCWEINGLGTAGGRLPPANAAGFPLAAAADSSSNGLLAADSFPLDDDGGRAGGGGGIRNEFVFLPPPRPPVAGALAALFVLFLF
mmetsp:Transcript_1111/g.2318  ORF Transcript_1111/g.2318 Transcript_1111/m.2318 type:complete len:241 (+) Transcript_1111:4894-5616(+)